MPHPQSAANDPNSVVNFAPFQVLNAWVDGDSLQSVVQHTGGCDVHIFRCTPRPPLKASLPSNLSLGNIVP